MPQYNFTDHAESDLDAVVAYTLEHWGQAQAVKYVNGLEALLENLALEPSIGTNQDHLFKDLLRFSYVSHVVYYIKNRDGITVIRILHKRMDAKRHFSETQKIQ
jgi:toxin ParE1/3/4